MDSDLIELKNAHLTRQYDLIPLNILNRKITIIGAGAVGSFTVFALCKMGFHNITVYDFDSVDIENLNSQIYRKSDLGKSKVLALQDIIQDFCDIKINIKNEKYTNQVFQDIVISAVDNMKTRKEIYENHKEKGVNTAYLIDPRMSIEIAYIQCIKPMDPNDGRVYERTLFTDDQGVQERCTNKSIIYTAQLIGATIAKIVKDIATNKDHIKRITWDIGNNEVIDQSLEKIA